MYNMSDSPLSLKSSDFAVRIMNMVEYLGKKISKKFAPILDQVLRSGTSVMANIGESQYAQSRADFISKLHISLKEANESNKWLLLLERKGCLTPREYESIRKDCDELIAMLTASIKTAKSNLEKEKGEKGVNGNPEN